MDISLGKLKAWVPPVASVLAVLCSAGYGLAKKSLAMDHIRELASASAQLSEAASIAQSGVVLPEKMREVENKKRDYEQRMEEAGKPGLVQAELMASARSAGLEMREVQSVAGSQASPSKDSSAYPAYRVLVEGSYQQICEYMQLCKKQRVPTRAAAFRVSAAVDEQGKPKKGLKAEITMEAFVPKSAERTAPAGS